MTARAPLTMQGTPAVRIHRASPLSVKQHGRRHCPLTVGRALSLDIDRGQARYTGQQLASITGLRTQAQVAWLLTRWSNNTVNTNNGLRDPTQTHWPILYAFLMFNARIIRFH